MLVKSKLACQPRFDFREHRAIVTGGSRGIGRAIADALGEAGAQVYAFDVGEPEHVESFPHKFVRIDIADTNAVKAAVAGFAEPPTLLVNNAGITRDRTGHAALPHPALGQDITTYPLSHLYGHFGLVRLCRLGLDVPWAKANSARRASPSMQSRLAWS